MFLDKLNKFNQNISYIIFTLNGYFALYPFIALALEKIGYEIYILYMLITAIYCFAGIIWCIEQIIEYKLPFAFLKHIVCTIVLLFGAIISTIYLFLFAMFFIYGFIVMPIIS
jgi:hypothetical protein